jgi:hypothetical protein
LIDATLNFQGAYWTFVCPSGYKGIPDRDIRIETFYKEGIPIISRAVGELGYSEVTAIEERLRTAGGATGDRPADNLSAGRSGKLTIKK